MRCFAVSGQEKHDVINAEGDGKRDEHGRAERRHVEILSNWNSKSQGHCDRASLQNGQHRRL